MQVQCPHCRQTVDTGQAPVGVELACPLCSKHLTVPAPAPTPSPAATPTSQPQTTVRAVAPAEEDDAPATSDLGVTVRRSGHARHHHDHRFHPFRMIGTWVVMGAMTACALYAMQTRWFAQLVRDAIDHEALAAEFPAETIVALHQNDPIKAKELCLEQTIGAHGVVARHGRDLLGNLYVMLESGNPKCQVMCVFPDQYEQALAGVDQGEHVKIRGICQGLTKGHVLLRNCSFYE